ncbi:MAG: hypothetical protein BWY83_02410 [bacterium ADurb.Bin478]|nr:MAG: hypothetical protein BWY83_02410 [bacterium ADurb.Bin478]
MSPDHIEFVTVRAGDIAALVFEVIDDHAAVGFGIAEIEIRLAIAIEIAHGQTSCRAEVAEIEDFAESQLVRRGQIALMLHDIHPAAVIQQIKLGHAAIEIQHAQRLYGVAGVGGTDLVRRDDRDRLIGIDAHVFDHPQFSAFSVHGDDLHGAIVIQVAGLDCAHLAGRFVEQIEIPAVSFKTARRQLQNHHRDAAAAEIGQDPFRPWIAVQLTEHGTGLYAHRASVVTGEIEISGRRVSSRKAVVHAGPFVYGAGHFSQGRIYDHRNLLQAVEVPIRHRQASEGGLMRALDLPDQSETVVRHSF